MTTAEYTSESAAVEAGLLAAILASPADDGPRLIYADWLDENGGDRPCYCEDWSDDTYARNTAASLHLGCSGRVSDGRRELAEFVRVQCELARLDAADFCPVCGSEKGCHLHAKECASHTLRRREQELFGSHHKEWVAGIKPSTGLLVPHATDPYVQLHDSTADPNWIGVTFRRGFADEIRCATVAFVGGECGRCDGTGNRPMHQHPPGSGSWSGACHSCSGSGRTVGLAAELARRHPLTRVALTDRRPMMMGWAKVDTDADLPNVLPAELFDRLPGPRPFPINAHAVGRLYGSDQEAEAALSAACVAYARAAAGLTGSPETP